MSDYKASGAQLRFPPEAKGLQWPEWIYKQSLWSKSERDAWIKARQAENLGPAKKPHSGALPANTEWL